jgi:hypothetical protein
MWKICGKLGLSQNDTNSRPFGERPKRTFFQPSYFHPRRVMESGRFGCSRSLLAFLSGFILRFRWI